MKKVRKILTFFKAWLFGAVGCQSLLGALVVTGWSYRYCHRRVIGHWKKRAAISEEYRSPRWFRSEQSLEGSWWQRLKWLFSSLKKNLLTGMRHGFTALLMTLVPSLLLAFAWWGGWNNSFNKGYEQSGVGPGLGVLGILIMAVSLMYLPMAQVHQAVCSRVGAFFEFRQVMRMIRQAPWGVLGVAILTALCGFPFILSALYLASAVATNPELLEMAPAQIIAYLNNYYFLWALLFVFPAFLLLRLLTARIYAGVSWKLASTGHYQHPSLDDLVETEVTPVRHGAVKYWRRSWKAAVFTTAYAALVVFSALPTIAQFSAALPATKRWLVHPMVHFPLHRHIPKPLKQAAQSAFAHEQSGFVRWLDEQE